MKNDKVKVARMDPASGTKRGEGSNMSSPSSKRK